MGKKREREPAEKGAGGEGGEGDDDEVQVAKKAKMEDSTSASEGNTPPIQGNKQLQHTPRTHLFPPPPYPTAQWRRRTQAG